MKLNLEDDEGVDLYYDIRHALDTEVKVTGRLVKARDIILQKYIDKFNARDHRPQDLEYIWYILLTNEKHYKKFEPKPKELYELVWDTFWKLADA